MAAIIEVEYFNSYTLKKVCTSLTNRQSESWLTTQFVANYHPGKAYPGLLSDGNIAPITFGGDGPTKNTQGSAEVGNANFFIEESRIRGGFNNVSTDYGVKAYLNEEEPLQQHRFNSLIYSGIYNSKTGLNQTNVFSVGDALTRSADPVNGSIQLTYAEDTNLIVFQENKISRALIDKDTIYTSEGGTQTQAGTIVIGQIVPYKGEYGISKNPESFAKYGYRKYFSDKNRNAVMRLSNDGLTEISSYGMQDYFRDSLAEISENLIINNVDIGTHTSTTSVNSNQLTAVTNDITGTLGIGFIFSYSLDNGLNYIEIPGRIVDIQNDSNNKTLITYSSSIVVPNPGSAVVKIRFYNFIKGEIKGGWDIWNQNYVISIQKNPNLTSSDESTFSTLAFDEKINGWVSFLTYKPTFITSLKNKFYSFNDNNLYIHNDSSTVNNRGLFYGVRKPSSVTFVFNQQSSIVKNFKTISYKGSNGWEVDSFVSGFEGFDNINPLVPGSYVQNQDSTTPTPPGVSVKSYSEGLYTDTVTGQPLRAGFSRKENNYVANLISNSTARAGEIIFGSQMTGIKGYFATVTIETDETTEIGGPKELWSSSTEFVVSSF